LTKASTVLFTDWNEALAPQARRDWSRPRNRKPQRSNVGRRHPDDLAALLGGTLGLAVCGALLVSGSNFFDVFLAPACLTLAVLALTWRYVAPEARAARKGGGIPVPAIRG